MMRKSENDYNLLVVDANSIVYRTYYASGSNNMSLNGQPIGAVYGFFNILLKAMQQYPTAYLAVCWDLKGPTFRHEQYSDYKGTRAPMPDDLALQIPLLKNALAWIGITQFAKAKYEADDLIGSLSKQAEAAGLKTLILTGDKDDFQLISQQVEVLMPKGGGVYELADEAYLADNYGVNGAGWLQMKAIMGDSSDNIPGVKGIGIKGAAKLIREYGDIDNLLRHLTDLSKKQQDLLSAARADLMLSLTLSTIDCSLHLVKDWNELSIGDERQAAFATLFSELKFTSLLQRYDLYGSDTSNFKIPFPKVHLFSDKLLFADEDTARLLVDTKAGVSEDADLALTFEENDLYSERSALRILLNHLTLFYEKYAFLHKNEWEDIKTFLDSVTDLAADICGNFSSLVQVNPEKIQIKEAEAAFFEKHLQTVTPWFYLPGLKIAGAAEAAYYPVNTAAAKAKFACETEFYFDAATHEQGLLWSPLLKDVFYVVNYKHLSKLLEVCQQATLPTYAMMLDKDERQTYESAKLYTFNLKELLKGQKYFALRDTGESFNFTKPAVTLKLLQNHDPASTEHAAEKNEICRSLTAFADFDVLAYIFGSQTVDLLTLWQQDLQFKASEAALKACTDAKEGKLISKAVKKGKYKFAVKELYDFCKNLTLFVDIAACQISLAALAPLTFQMEQPLVSLLAQMEQPRLQVDIASLKKFRDDVENSMSAACREVMFVAGDEVNLNSPEQVSDLLFNRLALPKPTNKKNKSGYISTKSEYLQSLSPFYPVVNGILEYRKYQKLLTFAEGLLAAVNPENACISTEYQQTRTATGRLSSINPNLQNIPTRSEEGHSLRSIFVAKAGKVLLDVDYSQIELRIVAALAQDTTMLSDFAAARDIHSEVAAKIFDLPVSEVSTEQRARAKAINFSLIYGATIFGTAERLQVSFKEAEHYLSSYFHKYTAIRPYMQYLIDLAQYQDYIVTAYGRRRYLAKLPVYNDAHSPFKALQKTALATHNGDFATFIAADAKKKMGVFSKVDNRIYINTPIQGTGADIIKVAMLAAATALEKEKIPAEILLQIHDELLIEVPAEYEEKAKDVIRTVMENIIDLGVKLEVNIACGQNWADIH